MDELRMSMQERIRLDVLSRVKRKELTVVEAAELMGLSLRQARRVWKRYREQGEAGLVHRLRGRMSNHRLAEDLRERIVKVHQEVYADFGATLACEKLGEVHGLQVSPNTLSRLLKERGLWVCRRRRSRHRKRRERRACLGSMVQMDGSHHDWFEGRAPWCVLMVLIDDATSLTQARFYRGETTEAAFDAFRRWIERYGIPRSVYVDRHSIYRDEDHPHKPTQFSRAMKELGVELICANSPQAKGRVERRNAVFQDRLVKEMRLRNLRTMEQANALLDKMFLEDLNRRYAIDASRPQDLHRAVGAELKLEQVLCVQEQRVVGQDWCVRWRNRWLQIEACHAVLGLVGKRVRVRELIGGELQLEVKGERLTYRELKARPAAEKKYKRRAIVNNRRWLPGVDHPWKRGPARRADPRVSLAPAAPARDLHAEKSKAG